MSACETDRAGYWHLRKNTYEQRDGSSARSSDHYMELVANARLKADADSAALVEQGKQMAIRVLIENRE